MTGEKKQLKKLIQQNYTKYYRSQKKYLMVMNRKVEIKNFV